MNETIDSQQRQKEAQGFWLGLVIAVACAWDSGVPGWLPDVDQGLVWAQIGSAALLCFAGIFREIQLKRPLTWLCFIVWLLFAELGIAFQGDMGYTRRVQCQTLRQHGKSAGAKILQTAGLFSARGSDRRSDLIRVKWQLHLPNGKLVDAEAIETQLDYIHSENRGDRVRYLPENPSFAKSEKSVMATPEFSPFDQARMYLLLLFVPAIINFWFAFLLLKAKSEDLKQQQKALSDRAQVAIESTQVKPEDVPSEAGNAEAARPMKPVKPNLPLVCVLTVGILFIYFGGFGLLGAIFFPNKHDKKASLPKVDKQKSSPAKSHQNEEELFPSADVPHLVAPYFHGMAFRWEKEEHDGVTSYKGFDFQDNWICQFDFRDKAFEREYLIFEGRFDVGSDEDHVKVVCYYDVRPDEVNPLNEYGRLHDATHYYYKIVGGKKYANEREKFLAEGRKYLTGKRVLTRVWRYHNPANNNRNDDLEVEFIRDQNNRLVGCQTLPDHRPFDLNANRQLLNEKFAFWSVFGQYE